MAAGRAWETVLERIESDLAAGALRVGDRLPPERTLALDLGVGRSSVREAVRVLEVLGLVRTATGSGPSAGATVVSRPEGAMGILMRLQVAGRGFAVDDVVRTRLVLERSVAAELATAPPPLRAARALLDAMDDMDAMDGASHACSADHLSGDSTDDSTGDPAGGPAGFLTLDTRFHTALAEATGNQVVAAIMSGLRGAIESYVTHGAAALPDWATTSMRLRREHRAILAAIDAGDASSAERLITEHISRYYAETRMSPPSAAPGPIAAPSARPIPSVR